MEAVRSGCVAGLPKVCCGPQDEDKHCQQTATHLRVFHHRHHTAAGNVIKGQSPPLVSGAWEPLAMPLPPPLASVCSWQGGSGSMLRAQPMQAGCACQPLAGERPQATRRCRKACTSCGSRNVYAACVGFTCHRGLGAEEWYHNQGFGHSQGCRVPTGFPLFISSPASSPAVFVDTSSSV